MKPYQWKLRSCMSISAIKGYGFRETKMHGTIFSYLGCMANADYNNGCCVPQFIFDTLHNPNEKRNQENE